MLTGYVSCIDSKQIIINYQLSLIIQYIVLKSYPIIIIQNVYRLLLQKIVFSVGNWIMVVIYTEKRGYY